MITSKGKGTKNLKQAAEHMLQMLSQFIGINTFLVATNNGITTSIIKVFNREQKLIEEGTSLPFEKAYWMLISRGGRESLIIQNIATHPLTKEMEVTQALGSGSFIGVPIILRNGRFVGTLCGLDTKIYHFSREDIALLQTMATFLSHILEIENAVIYESLFKHNPDASYLLDLEGRFLHVNPAAERVTGYAMKELLEMTFAPLIVREEREQIMNYFQSVKKGHLQKFETIIETRQGSQVQLHIQAIPAILDDEIHGVIGIATDITARKMAEQALKESEARKGAILEAALDAIMILDHQGAILEFNPAAENIFGVAKDGSFLSYV